MENNQDPRKQDTRINERREMVDKQLIPRGITDERVDKLSQSARRALSELGYANVSFKVGDGSLGLPEQAPFGAILVTAAAPAISDKLTEQLAEGGRMVIPVGTPQGQNLIRLTAKEGKMVKEVLGGCAFVPLIGRHGYHS